VQGIKVDTIDTETLWLCSADCVVEHIHKLYKNIIDGAEQIKQIEDKNIQQLHGYLEIEKEQHKQIMRYLDRGE